MESNFVYEVVALKKLQEPATKYLPPLPDSDREVLKKDIAKNGFNTPFLVDADYTIVDGCNRRIIADELGIKKVPVLKYSEPLTPAEIEETTLRLNMHRRQLTAQEKFEYEQRIVTLAANSMPAGKSSPIRKIAEKSGVPKTNVSRVLDFEKAVKKYPDLKAKPVTVALNEYKRREQIDAAGDDYVSVDMKVKAITAYIKEIGDPVILDGLKLHISYYATLDSYRDKVAKIPVKLENGEEEKATNPAAEVVLAYKRIYGYPVKDKVWNKIYFPQFVEPATLLLAEFEGNIDTVIQCIEYTGKECRENGWEWNLRTCLKRLHYFKKYLAKTTKAA